ncbi:MAG: PhoU domain-containing protein [Nanoarchaeota archaeon]|nr:PhoU domain-containing protein [Nanoarchaeota archaeon]
MEYRKLIEFGKNSYIISLPKNWIVKNKLKKGDLIYIDEKTDEIWLHAKHKQDENKNKEVFINVDGKNMPQIEREITTAYINNHNSFIISGKELENNAKEIRSIIQNLMALEIMDQTATKMVAKDFMDMETVSIIELIRKMDMITREMMSDSKKTLIENKYENIYLRDEDVNRLSYLVLRVALHALDNPQFAKKSGHKPAYLVSLLRIAYDIESIADETKRVSKYLREFKPADKSLKDVIDLFEMAENLYLSSIKSFFSKDAETAIKLSGIKKEIISRATEVEYKHSKNVNAIIAIEKIKNMAHISNEISRAVANLSFEKPEGDMNLR